MISKKAGEQKKGADARKQAAQSIILLGEVREQTVEHNELSLLGHGDRRASTLSILHFSVSPPLRLPIFPILRHHCQSRESELFGRSART